jgi:hypothetical protein
MAAPELLTFFWMQKHQVFKGKKLLVNEEGNT